MYETPQCTQINMIIHSCLYLFTSNLSSWGIKFDTQLPCIRCHNAHRQIWSFILVFILFTSFFTGNETWCSVTMYEMPQCTQINMIIHSCLYLFTSNLSSLGMKLEAQSPCMRCHNAHRQIWSLVPAFICLHLTFLRWESNLIVSCSV